MRQLIQHPKAIPALLLIGSIIPLGGALISQYGFGLNPCEMCIFQRIPYALIALLGFLALLKPTLCRLLLKIGIILWVIDAALAAYHTAIEQGWVESVTGCTAGNAGDGSIEALRAAILNSPLVSCADVAFYFMGLSMASWNIITTLTLAALGYYTLQKNRKI